MAQNRQRDLDELRKLEREIERRLNDANEERKAELRERLRKVRERIRTLQTGKGGPTPEQKEKLKAKEDAQKAKERRIKDAEETYENLLISIGQRPGEYRELIRQAAKNGWGREKFLQRAGLREEEVAAGEEESFIQGILSDYVDVHGTPPPADLIQSLQRMSPGELQAYAKNLRTQLEGKVKAQQTRETYLAQLTSSYFEHTGKMPPPGFVEKYANEGIDVFAFEWELKHRPEYEQTPAYFDRGQQLAAEVAQGLGL